MVHWMADRAPSRGIVMIIRHPCAVIASMLNMGDNWQPQDVEDRSLKERFNGQIPEPIARELRTIPGAVNSWVGHLATQWSLDHYFALHEHPEGPDDYPWVLTSYERLFIDGGGRTGTNCARARGHREREHARAVGGPLHLRLTTSSRIKSTSSQSGEKNLRRSRSTLFYRWCLPSISVSIRPIRRPTPTGFPGFRGRRQDQRLGRG
jgi:hypothetical protein